MKVAVSGVAGKVGKFVIKELMDHKYEVLALTHHYAKDCPVEQKQIDILDYEQVLESLKGCDSVIHLAAIPWPKDDNKSTVFQTNLVGNYNVVLAAGLLGIKHVAIASSDCALGFTFSHNKAPEPVYLPVDEEHPAKPNNGYGISKLLSEKMCDAMTGRFPWMSVASLRISHVTGPKDYNKDCYFYGWTKNPELGSWNLWSYIDGRDAAAAFRLAIEKDLQGHEVFYIAAQNTRCDIPSKELIEKYFPEAILKHKFRGNESLEDSSKAERILSFKARYNWKDGI